MKGLLEPNTRWERPRYITDEHGRRGTNPISYRFTADRFFVVGKETLKLSLTVWKGGEKVPVKITEAKARPELSRRPGPASTRPAKWNRYGAAAPLSLSEVDGVYRGTFRPIDVMGKHQGDILLQVGFEHAPGKVQKAAFRIQYTPEKQIPARFTGKFSDEAHDGSLVVEAGIEVFTKGAYVFEVNLFDARGEPAAWTSTRVQLEPGDTKIVLQFFGKVLRDAGSRSPFELKNLRGFRKRPMMNPDREMLRAYDGTYTTRTYPPESFSNEEWSGDQKDRLKRVLEEEIIHGHRSDPDEDEPVGKPQTP